MKKISNLFLAVFLLSCVGVTAEKSDKKENEKIIVAYVTSWTWTIPEVDHITHINYAFGHVNQTFDGITIDNEERLHKIVELKSKNPDLKVLLSVGGWGSGRFSEMAADDNYRHSFAEDCKRVIDEFKLDGIDIDWEYPSSDMANISASPDDIGNFSSLMKAIRNAVGEEKLVTLATSANGKYYAFPDFIDYVDFVNIMTYDMGWPPLHHSALYPSEFTQISGDESVKFHLAGGVPSEKLVYGIPFYGRAIREMGFANYRNIIQNKDYTEKWDDVSKVPYLVNDDNELVCSYDNPESIQIKCSYIIENNLLGAMFWDYDGDDDEGTLRKTLWEELKN